MENTMLYQNMTVAKKSAEEFCQLYNEAIAKNSPIEEVKDIEAKIDKAIADYGVLAKRACFDAIKASDNPMHAACIEMEYSVISAKDDKTDFGITRHIVDKTKPIDLEEVNKYCHGIGHDADWLIMLESFNYRLAIRTAEYIDAFNIGELRSTYAIQDIAKEYDLGKDPVSNNSMTTTLKKVITAMLGEEYGSKVLNHDVKFLITAYGSLSKKKVMCIKVSDHKAFRNTIQNMCHRILTDGRYSVEFKAKKA